MSRRDFHFVDRERNELLDRLVAEEALVGDQSSRAALTATWAL